MGQISPMDGPLGVWTCRGLAPYIPCGELWSTPDAVVILSSFRAVARLHIEAGLTGYQTRATY